MWQVLHNRYGWIALIGILLLALIVSLMMVAPLRTAATQFLNHLGFEPDDFRVYPTPANPQDFYGRVYAKTRVKAVRQIAVTSLEQASQLAGFRVLMPAYVPDGMQPVSITHVLVTSAHAYRVDVNLISARALLQSAGLPTDALPANKERAQVMAEVPPSVVIHQTQGSRWFTLILARNPLVTGLKELDLTQLRELDELGLRYLGLAQTEAHPLSQQMDWAAFLVVPPADMNVAEPVSIRGHGGYRLHGTGGYGDQAVIWEAEGVLYSIYGGLPATELMAMAESLE